MPIASLQPLAAPALAGGVLLVGIGALRPGTVFGPSRRPVRLLRRGVLALAALAGLVGLGLLLAARPDQAPVVCLAGTIVAGVVGFALHTRRQDGPVAAEDGHGDEDGGGGQRRLEPEPRPPLPPAAPSGPEGSDGPAVPWHEFDALRAGWDRVPAGRR